MIPNVRGRGVGDQHIIVKVDYTDKADGKTKATAAENLLKSVDQFLRMNKKKAFFEK